MKAMLIALSFLCAAPVLAQPKALEVAVQESLTVQAPLSAEKLWAAKKSEEARLAMKKRQYTAARDALLESTTNDPDKAEYHQQYGAALMKSGDAFSAADELQIAIELGLSDASTWDSLGAAQEKTKSYSEALDSYTQAAGLGSLSGAKNAKRMSKLIAAESKKNEQLLKEGPRLLKCSGDFRSPPRDGGVLNPFKE